MSKCLGDVTNVRHGCGNAHPSTWKSSQLTTTTNYRTLSPRQTSYEPFFFQPPGILIFCLTFIKNSSLDLSTFPYLRAAPATFLQWLTLHHHLPTQPRLPPMPLVHPAVAWPEKTPRPSSVNVSSSRDSPVLNPGADRFEISSSLGFTSLCF